MASIIENTLYAPRINPFRLYAERGRACPSKYAPGDTTSFQLVSRGNVFEGGYCNVYSKRGAAVSSIAPVVTTLNSVYNFYTFSITMPEEEGCYDIELGGTIGGLAHSNWGKAEIRKEYAELTQLQYFNSYNAFDVNFGLGCRFMLRTAGGFYPHSYQPKRQDTVYQDQDTSFRLLKSRVYNTMTFFAGDEYGISDEQADIINRAWACDNVFVDGKQYSVYEEASWEERSEEGYPDRTWTIEVVEAGNGSLTVFEITLRLEWGRFVCLERDNGTVTEDSMRVLSAYSPGTPLNTQGWEGSYGSDKNNNLYFQLADCIIQYRDAGRTFVKIDVTALGMPEMTRTVYIKYLVYSAYFDSLFVAVNGSGIWQIPVTGGVVSATMVSTLQTVHRMVSFDKYVYFEDYNTGLNVLSEKTPSGGIRYIDTTLLINVYDNQQSYIAIEQLQNSNNACLYFTWTSRASANKFLIYSSFIDMNTGLLTSVNTLSIPDSGTCYLLTSLFPGIYVRREVYAFVEGIPGSNNRSYKLSNGNYVQINYGNSYGGLGYISYKGYPCMYLPNDGKNVYITDSYNVYVKIDGLNEWQIYKSNPDTERSSYSAVGFYPHPIDPTDKRPVYVSNGKVYFDRDRKDTGISGYMLFGQTSKFVMDAESIKAIVLDEGDESEKWDYYGRSAAINLTCSFGNNTTKTVSIYPAFGDYPAIDRYARLSEEEIIERQDALIRHVVGTNNYTLLNSGIMDSDSCKPDTGETGYVFTASPLAVTLQNGVGSALINVVSTLNGDLVPFTQTYNASLYSVRKITDYALAVFNGGVTTGWEDVLTLYQPRQDGTFGIIEITVKNIADKVSDSLFHDGYLHTDNYLYPDSELLSS